MQDDNTIRRNADMVQAFPFLLLILEFYFFLLYDLDMFEFAQTVTIKFKQFAPFREGNILYTHIACMVMIMFVSIASKPKKSINLSVPRHIVLPLITGTIIYFLALYFYFFEETFITDTISSFEMAFIVSASIGAILVNVGSDNISKIVHGGFMKDKFNHNNESFEQTTKRELNQYSLNLPITYPLNNKIKHGWLNLTKAFRGTLVLGTPESGKTFSIIVPYIKTFVRNGHTTVTYDRKYPNMTKMVNYEHLRKTGQAGYPHKFHVIALHDVTKSRRVNPLSPKYMRTLADCIETSEALIQSLQKTSSASGTDRFFQLSAINFLAAVFYFLLKYKNGRFSTLPHVLAFINRKYEEIFRVLMSMPELDSILVPFKSAHENKAHGQLEGQLGTLRINLSTLATPESFWVFSGDDFDLRFTSGENPSHIIIANTTATESINATSNALLLNRLVKIANTKGNRACGIFVDELPTIYFHNIQKLMATARENKVAVVLGIQEIPQLVESYGQNIANTITSIIGNIISGQARKKETLEWLQQLFGKIKQVKTGINISRQQTTTNLNEHMDHLIPSSKIADLGTGEIVAKLATSSHPDSKGKENTTTYHCRVRLDIDQIKKEEENYPPAPVYYRFGNEEQMESTLRRNMENIKLEIDYIVQNVY